MEYNMNAQNQEGSLRFTLSQTETQINEIMKNNVGMQIGDAQGLKIFVFFTDRRTIFLLTEPNAVFNF